MNYKNVVKLMEGGGLTLEEAKNLDAEGMIGESLEFESWCERNVAEIDHDNFQDEWSHGSLDDIGIAFESVDGNY